MKITHGTPGFGPMMSESQVTEFLTNSKLNLRLGTVDEKGEPMVHPVSYLYENGKVYVMTAMASKKAKNIRNKNTVYFCVDDEKKPHKGVRGKASAIIIEETSQILSFAEKMAIKYYGDLDDDEAKLFLEYVKNVPSVVLELEPKYFATWDHSNTI